MTTPTLPDALRAALDGRWGHIKEHARTELPVGSLLPAAVVDA